MSSSSIAWSKPRQLIENVKSGSNLCMKVNNETALLLSQINQPLVIISIVGMYRSGKSYLMNLLAGTNTGSILL